MKKDEKTSKMIVWLLCSLGVFASVIVGTFVVWRVNLSHEVNAKLAAIRSAGLPTSGAELNAYYSAVPDNENAALVMTQAFALLRNYPDSRSNEIDQFQFPNRGQPLTNEQIRLLTGYVEMNAAALEKVSEAVKLPKSRYPIDLTAGYDTQMPHLAELKRLGHVAWFQALLTSDTTNAIACIRSILGMAQTLNDEPVLISQLVRVALIKMATSELEWRLNIDTLDETGLVQLSTAFATAENTNSLACALIGERATAIPYFCMSMAEIERRERAAEQDHEISGPPLPGRQPVFSTVTGFFERDLSYYLNVMDTNIALVSSLSPSNSLIVATDFGNVSQVPRQHYYILSAMMLPSLSNAVIHEVESSASLRLSTAALAIERFRLEHGQLPKNLNELVPQFLPAVPTDPFDGQPLRYHHLDKGYVVYSVGADGHDDGGREKPADWKSSDKTTYDITFTVER
jgi:hypothetical protein